MLRRLSRTLRPAEKNISEEEMFFTREVKMHAWVKPENLSLHHKERNAANRVFINEATKILRVVEKDARCPLEKYLQLEFFDCAVDWTQRLGGHNKLVTPAEDF